MWLKLIDSDGDTYLGFFGSAGITEVYKDSDGDGITDNIDLLLVLGKFNFTQ